MRATGPVYPTDAEEIVRRLAARRFSDGQIAYRLGCWRRTVYRIRKRANIPAALPSGVNVAHFSVAHYPMGPAK
jgi:DNA invertase Pin-like site-specific DNA recombinase